MPYTLERLDKQRHRRATFTCGNDQLDRYLHQAARQAQQSGTAVCFVLSDDDGSIAGYFTLTQHAVNPGEVDPELFRGQHKLPKSRKIPAILLGRLAVDRTYQGKGVGGALLARALEAALAASESVAAAAVVVDPDGESAKNFYQYYGFRLLHAESGRMFMPMREIACTLAEARQRSGFDEGA